ncbi:hypothetical protein BBBOND_0300920 [Babesia bigemina]|uniref:Uncharacterized protein n=1 Tax=Babesia bigemina TaxID=5866 RepID=A0A061D874_BABBI|nr:hypothetical protein BBBOND_0300920 [Babesia bigemina]CDR96187.1 hypothetical protein BBBOND_0300920 [Babesia bigemina]|eukprot:XP_012768373.1 hypothetical protein BBBOND_0300920 [Babesia bigemina]
MNLTGSASAFTHQLNVYNLVFSTVVFAIYTCCGKFHVFYGPSKLFYVAALVQCAFSIWLLGFPASYVAIYTVCIWSMIVRGLQATMASVEIFHRNKQHTNRILCGMNDDEDEIILNVTRLYTLPFPSAPCSLDNGMFLRRFRNLETAELRKI